MTPAQKRFVVRVALTLLVIPIMVGEALTAASFTVIRNAKDYVRFMRNPDADR